MANKKPKAEVNNSLYEFEVKKIKLIVTLSNGENLKYLIDPKDSDLILSTYEAKKFSFAQILEHEVKLDGRVISGSHLSSMSYEELNKPHSIS